MRRARDLVSRYHACTFRSSRFNSHRFCSPLRRAMGTISHVRHDTHMDYCQWPRLQPLHPPLYDSPSYAHAREAAKQRKFFFFARSWSITSIEENLSTIDTKVE